MFLKVESLMSDARSSSSSKSSLDYYLTDIFCFAEENMLDLLDLAILLLALCADYDPPAATAVEAMFDPTFVEHVMYPDCRFEILFYFLD